MAASHLREERSPIREARERSVLDLPSDVSDHGGDHLGTALIGDDWSNSSAVATTATGYQRRFLAAPLDEGVLDRAIGEAFCVR
jgi:hypothetical protein